jgi:hypothetical protein
VPPLGPFTLTGNEVACGVLDGSATAGMRAVGATTFFGTVFGDIAVGFQLQCQ